MSKELDLLKQIKRVDSNMSREQNQRYSELEQAIAELEELKRDVKRYFELYLGGLISSNETVKLLGKLSKVGNEE